MPASVPPQSGEADSNVIDPIDPSSSATDVAVSVRGVSKVFPGTRALDHVDLDIRHGEIHALCGGNGSGKSTLIKILSGIYQADGGTIRIGDQGVEAADIRPKTAYDLGVRVVHQDLAVFPDLSVAENMVLGSDFPVTAGRIRWRELKRHANEQIERFEIAARATDLIGDLPIATRTQVAIARALHDVNPAQGLLIFDEPTAAMPVHEVKILLKAIRRLAAQGHAILFVSHRFDEILALTDRVTVLRDGRIADEHRTSELTEAELVDSTLGRRAQEIGYQRGQPASDQTILSVVGLDAGPLRGITFDLAAGEVVGVAGLLGSGRSELLHAIYGFLPKTAGQVAVQGRTCNFRRTDQAISAGVVLVPEDRANQAMFGDRSVNDNFDVSVLSRYWRGLGFRVGRMRRDAEALRARFRVRSASGSVPIYGLSGGNQQKVIIGRWLRREPVLLLLDEPTQGVDVGARADIWSAVREVAGAGGAALIVTSDLEELAQVVDRAIILHDGRLTAHVPYGELTAHRLNELIYLEKRANNG